MKEMEIVKYQNNVLEKQSFLCSGNVYCTIGPNFAGLDSPSTKD